MARGKYLHNVVLILFACRVMDKIKYGYESRVASILWMYGECAALVWMAATT